jgi:hypothetical protein
VTRSIDEKFESPPTCCGSLSGYTLLPDHAGHRPPPALMQPRGALAGWTELDRPNNDDAVLGGISSSDGAECLTTVLASRSSHGQSAMLPACGPKPPSRPLQRLELPSRFFAVFDDSPDEQIGCFLLYSVSNETRTFYAGKSDRVDRCCHHRARGGIWRRDHYHDRSPLCCRAPRVASARAR